MVVAAPQGSLILSALHFLSALPQVESFLGPFFLSLAVVHSEKAIWAEPSAVLLQVSFPEA